VVSVHMIYHNIGYTTISCWYHSTFYQELHIAIRAICMPGGDSCACSVVGKMKPVIRIDSMGNIIKEYCSIAVRTALVNVEKSLLSVLGIALTNTRCIDRRLRPGT